MSVLNFGHTNNPVTNIISPIVKRSQSVTEIHNIIGKLETLKSLSEHQISGGLEDLTDMHSLRARLQNT